MRRISAIGRVFAASFALARRIARRFVRLLFGPDHRLVLPASGLCGALLLLADQGNVLYLLRR